MKIIGYTSGGSPIINDFSLNTRKTKGDKNIRIGCKCGHKTTKNQAKVNGGVCFSCKSPLNLT